LPIIKVVTLFRYLPYDHTLIVKWGGQCSVVFFILSHGQLCNIASCTPVVFGFVYLESYKLSLLGRALNALDEYDIILLLMNGRRICTNVRSVHYVIPVIHFRPDNLYLPRNRNYYVYYKKYLWRLIVS
jgi:hypothetical protein